MTKSLSFRKLIKDIDGSKLDIKIELSDPRNNGHQDFSITADYFAPRKRVPTESGCLHERILEDAPELKIFVDLHGSDSKGSPSFTVSNGFYFMEKETEQVAKGFLRVTDIEYRELKKAESEEYFSFLLEDLEIVERWESEAKRAIEVLEGLSGEKFEENIVKPSYKKLTADQVEDIQIKIELGYYSEEDTLRRRVKRVRNEKVKMLVDLNTRYDKKMLQESQDYEMKKILINLFSTTCNSIFYTHTQTICLNWSDSAFNKKYTEAEFKSFLDVAKENALLKGLKYELK